METKLHQRRGISQNAGSIIEHEYRQPRQEHLDRIHGALEPDPSYAESAFHAPHKWILEEVRESPTHARAQRGFLQLLPQAQITRWQDSGDGGRSDGVRVDGK